MSLTLNVAAQKYTRLLGSFRIVPVDPEEIELTLDGFVTYTGVIHECIQDTVDEFKERVAELIKLETDLQRRWHEIKEEL